MDTLDYEIDLAVEVGATDLEMLRSEDHLQLVVPEFFPNC